MKYKLSSTALSAITLCFASIAPDSQAQQRDRGEQQAAVIFQILASELALNDGQLGIAAATYLTLAKQTQDPAAARRATELAIEARSPARAEEAALIWLASAPQDDEAQATLDLLQVMLGRKNQLIASLVKRREQAMRDQRLEGFYDYVAGLAGRSPVRADGVAVFEAVSKPDEQKASVMYTRAMLYERSGQYNEMETLLRKIIAEHPDHAHAHNALGYHLADKNLQLDEALSLIERALSLSPQDAHILDSMGWVYFRRGNLTLAEKYLRVAHQVQPDAEIAAHLGEVLWTKGESAEAEKYWRAGFMQDPRNTVLLETIKRLGISPLRMHPAP